ncbi:MAG: clostripain-related cysteine peptidase [Thermoplasmata archaeon]|nr:clostripain-related cysteine peptidase [Thermoplasmata archaeon]
MIQRTKKSMCAILTLVFAFSAVGHATLAENDQENDYYWNILVYLQADNNLNDLTQTDLDELMAWGPSANSDKVNVLVFMDKLDEKAYLYKMEPGKMIDLPYDLNGTEVNTGDPDVFREFVAYAEENYSADHTLIFFWDHGGPTAGVGVDDNTLPDGGGPSDWLTHQELIGVLEDHPVDVLAMDECSIGQIEVAYEYAKNLPDTQYLVASESYIGYRGFPYDHILDELMKDPDMSPLDLSLVCVREFEELFMQTPYQVEILTTQSVIDLREVEALSFEFGALLEALKDDLKSYRSIVKSARASAILPWGSESSGRIDLPTFVQTIANKAPSDSDVKLEALDFLTAYNKTVPEMGGTKNSANFDYRGLGILFPQSASFLTIASAGMFENYKTFDFPDNGWLQFLEAYWGVTLI